MSTNNWGKMRFPNVVQNASVASDGANARIGQFGPVDEAARVASVWWSPTGADQGADTASYRRLTLYNGGSLGTGTTALASLNLSASLASLGARAFTVNYPASATNGSSGTIAAGDILYVSHATVGGAHATGTVLRAGQFSVTLEGIG